MRSDYFCFFKQKTAYEMRISDWSSDVCSSDLFVSDRSAYVAPPSDGRSIEIRIDPQSERLQALHPWPAWDGEDFAGMPVLAKAKGKTTTDQISPAGPWLALRGHQLGRASCRESVCPSV